MILGIDTSIGTAVAVVADDGSVLSDIASSDRLGHAERIGTMIEQALAAASASPGDVTAVAAGMGPGPFTGLRVGIAAARAFALGRGVPVVDVVSHDAAALSHREGVAADAASRPFAIITDARRREVAVSVYADAGAAMPERIVPPTLHPKGPDVAIDDLSLATDETGPLDLVEVTEISAAALGRIAVLRLRAHESDPLAAEPLYLRSPDVTLSAGPKRVGT